MNPVGGVNSHARPSHSTRVPGHLSRGAVPPEVSDGGVLLPAGPGGGPHLFCMGGTAILGGFRSLPYKLYGVFRHTFCMAKHLHISKSGQGVAVTKSTYFDLQYTAPVNLKVTSENVGATSAPDAVQRCSAQGKTNE